MSGNITCGQKAAAKNKLNHGQDFYRRIGAAGGKLSTTGGFYTNPALASKVGIIGGQRGKQGYKYIREDEHYRYYVDKVTGKSERFLK
jgi:general stress protein YciG